MNNISIKQISVQSISYVSLCLLLISLLFSIIFKNPFGFTLLLFAILLNWALVSLVFFRFSVFMSAIFGYIQFFVLNILVYVFFLTLNEPIDFRFFVFSHVLVLLTIWIIRSSTSRNNYFSYDIQKFLIPDLFSIILTIICSLLILAPFIGTGSGDAVSKISIGEDNASHLSLHGAINKQRSLLYRIAPDKTGVLDTLRTYPQGFQGNLAVPTMIVFKNNSSKTQLIKSHILQISIMYALFSGLIIYAISFWINKIKSSIVGKVGINAIICFFIFYYVALGALFYLFTYGFQSQIISYIFLIFCILGLTELTHNKEWKINFKAYGGLTLLFLTIICISYTWFFLLPTLLPLFLYWLIRYRAVFMKNIGLSVLITCLTGIIAIIPIAFETVRPQGNSLLASGAIWKPSLITLTLTLYLFTLLVVGVVYKKIKISNPLLIVTLTAFIFAAIIGVYMQLSIGRFEYYFYKAEYTLVLLATISVGYLLYSNYKIITFNKYRHIVLFITFIFLIFGMLSINPKQQITKYLEGSLPKYVNPALMSLAISSKYEDVIIKNNCNSAYSYMNQRWIGAIMLNDDEKKNPLYLSYLYDLGQAEEASAYRQYSTKHNVKIVDGGYCN